MDALRVRFFPELLARTPGLDAPALTAAVQAQVRAQHARPEHDSNGGPPEEEAVIRSVTRQGDGSFQVRFGYWRNRFPSSRQDRSEAAEGELLLDGNGSVRRAALCPLRDRF